MTRAVVLGGFAEIGQRREIQGSSPRPTLASRSSVHSSVGVTAPLEPMSRAGASAWALAWPGGRAHGRAILADERQPSPTALPAARIGIPRFLRSREFWASFAVLVFRGLATLPFHHRARARSASRTPPINAAERLAVVVARIHWRAAALYTDREPLSPPSHPVAARLAAKAIALVAPSQRPKLKRPDVARRGRRTRRYRLPRPGHASGSARPRGVRDGIARRGTDREPPPP